MTHVVFIFLIFIIFIVSIEFNVLIFNSWSLNLAPLIACTMLELVLDALLVYKLLPGFTASCTGCLASQRHSGN